MHFLDIILKKRDGLNLSKSEIDFFVNGYVSGAIPDYQASALLMAIWFSKMDDRETADLTFALRDSGHQIDLTDIPGIKVDKHSTGGVADTTSLITAPVTAACGLRVAKISGRGLGHTGGTIDKIESIPGCRVDIDMARFKQIVSETGISIIGQTAELVPADKLLYALRDVTGTVDNISLIAASIMSKKLASGSDVIVLDVKTGNGAFMKEMNQAVHLARTMVAIGKAAEKSVTALVTDMNQPLGNAVGNALEVKEAIQILKGEGAGDLKTVALALSAQMVLAAGKAANESDARSLVEQALSSGNALDAFGKMIKAHGGDPGVCEDPSLLPQAAQTIDVECDQSGFVTQIQTDQIGTSALLLGAGRAKKTDNIDPAVGIWMDIRLGDVVNKGDRLARFHVNDSSHLDNAIQRFKQAITVHSEKPEPLPLIYKKID